MKSSLDTQIFLTEKYTASVAIVGCLHCPSSAHVRSRGKSDIFLPPKEILQQQSECYFAFSYAGDESFSREAKEEKKLKL